MYRRESTAGLGLIRAFSPFCLKNHAFSTVNEFGSSMSICIRKKKWPSESYLRITTDLEAEKTRNTHLVVEQERGDELLHFQERQVLAQANTPPRTELHRRTEVSCETRSRIFLRSLALPS